MSFEAYFISVELDRFNDLDLNLFHWPRDIIAR